MRQIAFDLIFLDPSIDSKQLTKKVSLSTLMERTKGIINCKAIRLETNTGKNLSRYAGLKSPLNNEARVVNVSPSAPRSGRGVATWGKPRTGRRGCGSRSGLGVSRGEGRASAVGVGLINDNPCPLSGGGGASMISVLTILVFLLKIEYKSLLREMDLTSITITYFINLQPYFLFFLHLQHRR